MRSRAARHGPDLDRRTLGRAMLERQLLLRRAAMPVEDAVERLLGLNAQEPDLPYLALWSRLEGFTIPDLSRAIEDGALVRSTLMRATQHLMTAEDFRLVRPALSELLRRVQRNAFGRRTAGIDLDALVVEARALLADGPALTRPELGRRLAASRPGADPTALGWSVQYLLPVVHPAPSGTWRTRGATPFVLPNHTAAPPRATPGTAGFATATTAGDLAVLVRRYLAAFGPATVSDARVWSGIGGLREIFELLRPELRVFSDDAGRELFDLPDTDLPDGELPDKDTPAPVRLLPAFDATLLAYDDRTRVMTDEVRAQVCVGAGVAATVLVDGTVAATWETTRKKRDVTVAVRPFRRLTAGDEEDIEAEAHRLLTFTDLDARGRFEMLHPGT
ncbi:winged helix DNA-binding domain-containing protein [Georgenia halophila]|uniref:Winged helix DNA-binding domain-containing protein n=1 Tax=Georgenia halophila TaxID=620889 RepID=A0ABP8L357_9MICO